MFDLAWSEIALIAVVAVVVIGPKDLPDAVRGVARGIQKLRRMAGEFQGHLDEVVREAKLEDVRDQIRDIRNFDLKSTIEKAVDEDGTLTRTMREDPFRAPPPPTSDAAPAAGTEAVLPDAPPPVDATEPPAPVVAAEAAADTPDATPPAPEPSGTPAAIPANGQVVQASGLSPIPEPLSSAAVSAPATPRPDPALAPAATPEAETPPRPAAHTA
ncbi:Sec-independent protein translocase protein TatB [Pararoseomonas indoligenes]|uniref:Sec-independent protein translocase protein TatB n=1 Tax=Roseomonas indoligenes TaxID=2820811 RepID=A0A940S5D6_9PROT|nr:Sec-independent protein translocase protein TatB [Pararoseomonas indoligenes]MBP0492835.1 twin-arginine translocase subunit TatB [Pararoseomonas indoligenes]